MTQQYSGPDHCNKEGATRLKLRLEEYWRERGYLVEMKIVPAGFVTAMRSAREDVRSDMINGFPTKRAEPEVAKPPHYSATANEERQLQTA
ncbi:MAG TPA: hypothetical protein PK109_03860 [Candidatus Paceibacterota bacterium]|nr:hypothetical protein [Candidatus Paceibacterota bacterium]